MAVMCGGFIYNLYLTAYLLCLFYQFYEKSVHLLLLSSSESPLTVKSERVFLYFHNILTNLDDFRGI